MNENQVAMLISQILIGLSFLAEGLDRLFLIIVGGLWLFFGAFRR